MGTYVVKLNVLTVRTIEIKAKTAPQAWDIATEMKREKDLNLDDLGKVECQFINEIEQVSRKGA